MSDLTRLSAVQIAEAVANGDVSAHDVAVAHLDEIGATDGQIHAFLHVDRDQVVADAVAVDDRRAAGEPQGSLA
ncbi:MAG TPA: Asp-tRNA(Asn)/Glu-tRNA(Gln) amidotransferase GatCAB subunit A, partial [Actinomycetes bacterium]|nr:Asp-tRNA(Asn)/Glu-tRNA(Gln) amidotransferase GatCAB subunit A [Actinomycetes bacterium]